MKAGCACGSALRRSGGAARWLGPGTLLLLMPKCPACLAGYVALWTGLGLSFTAAEHVRTGLIVLCVAALAYAAGRTIVGWRRRHEAKAGL
ncbi:MAG: hypothetical protein V4773_25435 [Verrucomicrobiota bacterium]